MGGHEAGIDALPWSGDALERLSELRAASDYLAYLIGEAVKECRATYPPITWERIGLQLGTTRQAAQQRYGWYSG